MKVLVCGGRTYGLSKEERDMIYNVLYEKLCPTPEGTAPNESWLPPKDLHLISGGAKGVDSVAVDWAIVNWVQFTEVNAEWTKYGKAAGHIRNTEMLKLDPDLVIAFPGGRGTADKVAQAKKANVKVLEIE